jgi:hypothetical protein
MNETPMTVTYEVWGYIVGAALYGTYIARLLIQMHRLERGDDVGPR